MSTIQGLSAPNPYAQTIRPPTAPAVAVTQGKLPERAQLDRVTFTPDWMLEEQGLPAPTRNSVYSANGKLG
jgi:hypothetical protein